MSHEKGIEAAIPLVKQGMVWMTEDGPIENAWRRTTNAIIAAYLAEAQPTSEGEERPPIAVMLAVEILCNHVEPGWENSKTIVRAWIDEERAARSSREGGKR